MILNHDDWSTWVEYTEEYLAEFRAKLFPVYERNGFTFAEALQVHLSFVAKDRLVEINEKLANEDD
jgi:hypothetical protein